MGRLGVGQIPHWVMNLAGAGASIMSAGDTVCCKTLAGQSLLCCGDQLTSKTGAGSGPKEYDDLEVVNVVEALPVLPPFKNTSGWRAPAYEADDFKESESTGGSQSARYPERPGLAGLMQTTSRSTSRRSSVSVGG